MRTLFMLDEVVAKILQKEMSKTDIENKSKILNKSKPIKKIKIIRIFKGQVTCEEEKIFPTMWKTMHVNVQIPLK